MVRARKGVMSRTFKDQPWWVRSTEWVQVHHDCEFEIPRRFVFHHPSRACNLPPEPSLAVWKTTRATHWRRQFVQCFWEPKFPSYRTFVGGPPKWYIDHIWNNPVRTREREYARRALKEFRANGDVEEILPDEQHHHRAGWYYW
jgi:hypothetical protein